MDFTDLLKIDQGVTTILSMIAIYLLVMIVRKGPDWLKNLMAILQENTIASNRIADVTETNIRVLQEVQEIFSKTEQMHINMDNKLDVNQDKLVEHNKHIDEILEQIQQTLSELSECVDDTAIPKIIEIKNDVELLKKDKCDKGGDKK